MSFEFSSSQLIEYFRSEIRWFRKWLKVPLFGIPTIQKKKNAICFQNVSQTHIRVVQKSCPHRNYHGLIFTQLYQNITLANDITPISSREHYLSYEQLSAALCPKTWEATKRWSRWSPFLIRHVWLTFFFEFKKSWNWGRHANGKMATLQPAKLSRSGPALGCRSWSIIYWPTVDRLSTLIDRWLIHRLLEQVTMINSRECTTSQTQDYLGSHALRGLPRGNASWNKYQTMNCGFGPFTLRWRV